MDAAIAARYGVSMRRTLIIMGVVLTSVFVSFTATGAAQADTVALYNEYTNDDLCTLIGHQGETLGQWIWFDCQQVYPEGVSTGGQWDLWVEYAS
jgi:hypothetical protein